jgi:subtilisin family serine protease
MVSILSLILLGLTSVPTFADEIRDAQWYVGTLGLEAANSITRGEGVVIANIDTSVDRAHPDLAGAILPALTVAGSDGRKQDIGHGTAMAGIMVARGRSSSSGILGVASRASLFPIDLEGVTAESVAEGISLAIDREVGVICSPVAVGGKFVLEEAIERALAADIVVVASAGNRPDPTIQAPAKYPGVVAAVGTNQNGEHAEISVVGKEAGLGAPSVDIVSTELGGGYSKGAGTSYSAAIIAGVAALVRSKFPELSAREVVHRMTATAVDKGKPGRDEEYGYGIVNPVGALTADVPPLGDSPSPGAPTAGAQPSRPDSKGSAALGWIIAALLAAAGAGAVIAFRRVHSKSGP